MTKQVTYARPNDRQTKFVLNIDDDSYHQLNEAAPSDNINYNDFRVMRSAPDGSLYQPNEDDLKDVFGTADLKYVSHFMIRQGELEGPLVEELERNTKPY